MKLTGLIFPFLIAAYSPVSAQYYFTGEVKDLHGDKLQRVAVIVKSTGLVYLTGRYGDFEITSKQTDDSLTFAYNGYEQYTTAIKATDYLKVTLKMLTPPTVPHKPKLSSLIPWEGLYPYPGHSAEKNFGTIENPYLDGAANMSFVGNPNGISYNNLHRFLDMGVVVPPEAVKIEEMMQYFNFRYEDAAADELFHCSSDLIPCPWNRNHQLLAVNINAKRGDMHLTPPTHLVFVIDASGSMDMPNKLPLIKAGMRSLVRNLRDYDSVSFVQYGANVSVLTGISGEQKGDIIRAIEQLHADGETPGDQALKLGFRVAQKHFIPHGANRVILITDGDVCNDQATEAELEDFVGQQADGGVTLTCIGVGMTDGENTALPVLAKKGKGNFTCVVDEQEGERLLLKELNEGLLSVADSVFITAGFDTTLVAGFRLIGYDNKRSPLEDTALTLEGATVSSAHSMTALFELVPRKDSTGISKIARMRISYCLPGKRALQTIDYDCPNGLMAYERADPQLKKTICIALFGMLLKRSPYAGTTNWTDLEKMARKVFAGNNYIDKEFINLVLKAKSVYEHK